MMVQGLYVPAGVDGEIVAALEKFAESLVGTLADQLWEEGDGDKERAAHVSEAEGIIGEELRRYLQFGGWRTYR